MNGNEIDMRMFAQRAGANVTCGAGSVVFNKGDPGSCMYIVQSGVIEMMIGDKVIEVCGPNEAIGFMSMIDGAPRSYAAGAQQRPRGAMAGAIGALLQRARDRSRRAGALEQSHRVRSRDV